MVLYIYIYCNGAIAINPTTLGFKATAQYNDIGVGYINVTNTFPNDGRYPIDMNIVLDGAAMIANIGQTDVAKGWCDNVYISSKSDNYVAYIGGNWGGGIDLKGPFSLYFMFGINASDLAFGGRLVSA